jgi:hypothetical protein
MAHACDDVPSFGMQGQRLCLGEGALSYPDALQGVLQLSRVNLARPVGIDVVEVVLQRVNERRTVPHKTMQAVHYQRSKS